MKNMIKYAVAGVMLCSLLAINSCTDFEEINTNPNRVSFGNITATKLLQNIIYDGVWQIHYNSWRINGDLAQYSMRTSNTYELVGNFEVRAATPLSIWRGLYRWASAADHMYHVAQGQDDVNCQAIALTLKVFYSENITAIFGDVPYSEAFQWADEVFYPTFDNQSDIYIKMLAELDDANFLYNHGRSLDFPTRDLLFGGDTRKWQRFTNSLRLRLLMRISKCWEIDAPAEIAFMLSNPTLYPIFTNNAEGAILRYTGDAPFYNQFGPSGTYDPMSTNSRLCKTFTDILNSCSDPRLPFYATLRSGGYEGLLAGQTFNYIEANLSWATYHAASLSTNSSPSTLLSYAEVLFIRAEAALRGWTSEDPRNLYEAAVTAAVRQYVGENAILTAMLADSSPAGYKGTLQQIMEQKYVAQYLVGYEAWCDYRRTGWPVMTIGPAMTNFDSFGIPTPPTRLTYPVVTQTTNYENYKIAVDRMGGTNNMLTKVWWASGSRY